MRLTEVIERAAEAFDVVGVATLVVGFVWSVIVAARGWRVGGGHAGYQALRATFGRVLLLGLEFLVAADLIRTVAVSPTLINVLVLATIVAIRTLLSFSLQVEIDGVLPWRHGESSRAGRS